MTKNEFESLCAQQGLVETDTASVAIEHDDEEQTVTITVTHKVVAIEPCAAHHPLSDDGSLTRTVEVFAQFIAHTAGITELPALPVMDISLPA